MNGLIQNLVKAIILDFDGTLVDLQVDWIRLKDHLGKKFDRDFTKLHENLKKLTEKEKLDAMQIIKEYEILNFSKWKTNNNLINWIKDNSNNYFFFILSNNSKTTIKKFLDKTGMNEFITEIVSINDIKNSKPDDEGLKKILRGNDLEAKDVLLIGDGINDKIIAKNNNAKYLIINSFSSNIYNRITEVLQNEYRE